MPDFVKPSRRSLCNFEAAVLLPLLLPLPSPWAATVDPPSPLLRGRTRGPRRCGGGRRRGDGERGGLTNMITILLLMIYITGYIMDESINNILTYCNFNEVFEQWHILHGGQRGRAAARHGEGRPVPEGGAGGRQHREAADAGPEAAPSGRVGAAALAAAQSGLGNFASQDFCVLRNSCGGFVDNCGDCHLCHAK